MWGFRVSWRLQLLEDKHLQPTFEKLVVIFFAISLYLSVLHWFHHLVTVNLLQCNINSNTRTITYSVLMRDGFILLVCTSGWRRKSTGCLQNDHQISLVDYWQTQGKSTLSSNREHEVWIGGVFKMMVLENAQLNTFSENINSLHCVLFITSVHWDRMSSAHTSWTALL